MRRHTVYDYTYHRVCCSNGGCTRQLELYALITSTLAERNADGLPVKTEIPKGNICPQSEELFVAGPAHTANQIHTQVFVRGLLLSHSY